MKHKSIVLNLTGLRGLARSVLAQNAFKVLYKLGFNVENPEQTPPSFFQNITAIAVCTGCGNVHFTSYPFPVMDLPQGVQVFDATYEYSPFVTALRQASEDAAIQALEDWNAIVSILERMTKRPATPAPAPEAASAPTTPPAAASESVQQ